MQILFYKELQQQLSSLSNLLVRRGVPIRQLSPCVPLSSVQAVAGVGC